MIKTTCKKAGKPKACPKKVTDLFYVTHPKAPRPLMGPFLAEADAECGRVIMRSTDAMVTTCPVGSIDDITHRHAANNGRICRAFAGAAKGAA